MHQIKKIIKLHAYPHKKQGQNNKKMINRSEIRTHIIKKYN